MLIMVQNNDEVIDSSEIRHINFFSNDIANESVQIILDTENYGSILLGIYKNKDRAAGVMLTICNALSHEEPVYNMPEA